MIIDIYRYLQMFIDVVDVYSHRSIRNLDYFCFMSSF